MKATLLHQADSRLGGKTGANDKRGPDDRGGASTTSVSVYAITDKHGQTENVDTRDLSIVR